MSLFERLFSSDIVLYGAGITGVETYKILSRHMSGATVVAFCDRYKSGMISGVPIIDPDAVKAAATVGGIVIIITALRGLWDEIGGDLSRAGVSSDVVFTLDDLDAAIAGNIGDPRLDDWYRSVKSTKLRLRNPDHDLYLNWWCPDHYCTGDILVYQPGKVGSSTICNSLSVAGVNVTHVHMLTGKYLFDLIPEIAWRPSAIERALIEEASRACIEKIKSDGGTKVISLVREPIARDYSNFMYHVDELDQRGYLKKGDDFLNECIEGMRLRATQNGSARYGYQFEWFRDELRRVFGIDVYSHPFDRKLGYSLIEENGVSVLIIKLEKLANLTGVVADFAGLGSLALKDANRSAAKRYHRVYAETKARLVIPDDILSIYYEDNPLMNHFYGEDERDLFLSRWRGPS
jgi:hypothetical protein